MSGADFAERLSFFGGQIRNDRAFDSCCLGLFDILFRADAHDNGVADHRDHRGGKIGSRLAEHIENALQFDSIVERSRIRSLDHGAIGNRVAVRDAKFADVATTIDQFLQQGAGEIQVGVAGRNKRHEGFAVFSSQSRKEFVNL